MIIANTQITAVILAGGRAKRMAEQDKGLILLNKKPLIKYIIETFSNKVATILINANRNQDLYQKFVENPIISDSTSDFQGPLAGFAAAMQVAKTPYLLVLPCDCPIVSVELLAKLKAKLTNNVNITIAHDGERLQPTFALLKVDLLPNLRKYLAGGGRKIDLWFQQQNSIIVDFSKHKNFFVNLNTPNDFAFFTNINKIKNVPILGFSAFSGTGKTTLITQLITHLTHHKISVAYIKHADHNFEIDYPGKDSYQCYHAGAKQVLISSAKRFALINRCQKPADLLNLVAKLDLKYLDLILVEGFKSENFQKIELQRASLQHPNLFTTDPNIFAVASDISNTKCNRIMLDLNNIPQISNFIKSLIQT